MKVWRKGFIILLIALLFNTLPVMSQNQWDLGIDTVKLFPINGEVQQGEPLYLSVYIRNHERKLFSGIVKVNVYVDGSLKVVEFWDIGNLSKGSIPIPAGGYTTITTEMKTSNLTVGIHDLRVSIEVRDYEDPRPEDNSFSLKFSVIPFVNAFMEAKKEMIQGREYYIKVHVPNPSDEPLNLKVRLFVNETEVDSKDIYVLPRSISLAEFPYTPRRTGTEEIKATITKEGQPYSQASISIKIRPSCDMKIEEIFISSSVFKGGPLRGRIRIYNNGFSSSAVNLTIQVDSKTVNSQVLGIIPPKKDKVIELVVPTINIGVGNHTLTALVYPTDATDLDESNNIYSLSFIVKPLPVSLSIGGENGIIRTNVTNMGEVLGNFDVILLEKGKKEIDRSSLTLEPKTSQVVIFKGIEPGNYSVIVLSYGFQVASANIFIEHSLQRNATSPYWTLVLGILVSVILYLAFTKWHRKKWPSS